MALWMVRAGKLGERERESLQRNAVAINWDPQSDLSSTASRSALSEAMRTSYPDESAATLANWVGQMWSFMKVVAVGDLVAMPLKRSPSIWFGRVISDYTFDPSWPGAQHSRKVEWLREIPRAHLDQDLLNSFGAIMTVCRIERNDAESRIRAIIQERSTGPASRPTVTNANDARGEAVTPPSDTAEAIDLEEASRDAIRRHIARKFSGHGLAGLVEAVLNAQGYKTYLSPPGPDGGVDVLAGRGAHGFDGPRLAVQVKSGGIEVDTSIFREFRGIMEQFGATQGLIVSWGGFRSPVRRDLPAHYFKIRMWNSDDLIAEVMENYDRLPAAIQATLPLKRIWTLVPDGSASEI